MALGGIKSTVNGDVPRIGYRYEHPTHTSPDNTDVSELSDTYYRDSRVTVHAGDCPDTLATMGANTIDVVVCDPPYALEFRPGDQTRSNRRARRVSGTGMDQMTSAQQAQQSNRDRSGRYRTKPHAESDTSLASATARPGADGDGDGEPSRPRVEGVPGDALVNGFDAGRLDGYSRSSSPPDATCEQYRHALRGIGDDDLAAICRTQTSQHWEDPSGPGSYKMFLPNNEWQRRSTVYRRHESDRVLARRLADHADTGDAVADPIEKMDVRATRAELDFRHPAAREERITWVQQATDRQLAADRTGWRHFLAAIPDTESSR